MAVVFQGVGRVAFVKGCSFEQALKLLDRPEKAESTGYQRKEVLAALNRHGGTYRPSGFGGGLKTTARGHCVPDGSVAYVLGKNRPVGHYVVRHRSAWMCPLTGFVSDVGDVLRSHLAPLESRDP